MFTNMAEEKKVKEPRKSTLYLNMILKWDEPLEMVERSIASIFNQVDGVYITLTFPEEFKKDTPLEKMLVEKFKANISYFKWIDDFASARNFAIAQVPRGKTTFIYWQDADDILQGAEHLHKISDMAVTFSWAAVFFHYWYMVDLDENGEVRNVVVDHVRERIIRNDGTFKWIGMLHEILIEQKQENVIKVNNSDCTVIHISSSGKRMDDNIDRNVRILEKQVRKENRKDPRTIVYLAKAYVDKGKIAKDEPNVRKINFDMAMGLFDEYLEGYGRPGAPGYQEGSGWPQERATAWAYIGELAILNENYPMALEAFHSAIGEAPEFPNYYVDLAMTYSMMGDFKKGKHWLNVATNIEMPNTTIITTPRDFMTRALEVGYHLGLNTGNLDLAKESVDKLIEIYPTLPLHQERKQKIEDLMKSNKVSQSIVYLGKYLEEIKDKKKLSHLVQSIPDDLKQERFATEMRHLFLPLKKWKDNEIAILCGPGFEQWTPKSLKTGLGGSEEAIVYLTRELKKLGWKPSVYANPGPDYGDYDGVKYLQWYDLNPKDEFNVLILWRAIGFADFKPKSKFTMVWLHDVPNNPDFTDERVAMVNKIAPLSEYHKSLLRVFKNGVFQPMPEDKILLTSNGISEIKVPEVKRDQYRMIYSSSPDRGLVYLLRMWPNIKKEVPQANLDIYYGFQIFDKIYPDNPGKQKWKKMVLDMMKQDGITYHGRVGHDELHKAMAGTGIWAYPTDFDEISCITAMKCQALGAIPVVINRAALKETVRNGIKIDMDITTEAGQKEYSAQLIRLLNSEDLQNELRPEMMKWASSYFGWDKVAQQWDREFRIKIQNPELSVKKEV